MAGAVLAAILSGKITTQELFTWLEGRMLQVSYQTFSQSTQGEFVSHFLNYIHENAPCSDNSNDTPRKVHTPKSIRKLQTKSERTNRRRTPLFPELTSVESTPKHKSHLSELNCPNEPDYAPLSPIYSRGTPRIKMRGFEEKTLGDYIVPGRMKKAPRHSMENIEPQETRRSRRINPTNLSRKFSNSFGGTENSFDFKETKAEIAVDNVTQHRSLLVEERLKITELTKTNSITIVPKQSINKGIDINPDFNMVTYKDQLEILILVYGYLITNNFILNIASELYFIISLALTKHFAKSVDDDLVDPKEIASTNIFTSIHNTVYFAVKVLEGQMNSLLILDKSTLKFLSSNERLKSISTKLALCAASSQDEPSEKTIEEVEKNTQHVCFMSETDNRDNFPTDFSFHAFRKQRDMFYEILKIWEEQRFLDGWSCGLALGGKIKTLFTLNDDVANYRHFCRLFKAQLLMTCRKHKEQGLADDQLSFLSTLPNVNSEKLNRLRSRLVTKSTSNGINSLPTFIGHQEFYKEFIVIAAKHKFNVHLRNTFIQGILELNDTKFSKDELDDKDTSVDMDTKHAYLLCIRSLRVLAKFLGFIESLPHRKQNNVPDKVISAEIMVRQWERPTFDLKLLLEQSVLKGTLILSIPWVVKYLAMLDPVTLRLPHYESLYDVLFELFRSKSSPSLVKLCLGWLFELPHFPSEFYYAWYTRNVNEEKELKLKCDKKVDCLDDLELVDKNVIYACCPYLTEFKSLLQYNCTENGTITFKHITPVSAVESPKQVNDKRLKLQLEEAFFNGHPSSVRKTVEFVSERVASACVKYICSDIVNNFKKDSLKDFKEFLEKEVKNTGKEQFSLEMKSKCTEFLQQRVCMLKEICLNELEKQVCKKIIEAINLLLSHEELPQTKNACSEIAARMCRERVIQWINTHVNENVFKKEYDIEVTKILSLKCEKEETKCSSQLPERGREGPHNPDVLSAPHIIDKLRLACVETIESSQNINQDTIVEIISNASNSFESRCDVNDVMKSLIARMLLDLVILLITHRPEICTSKVLDMFIIFWKHEKANWDIFSSTLCPRNVQILGKSVRPQESWSLLASFLALLLQNGLIDCEEFETQCLSLYQQNWDGAILNRLSSCFQSIIEEYGRHSPASPQFTYLLDYLSGFCADLDF